MAESLVQPSRNQMENHQRRDQFNGRMVNGQILYLLTEKSLCTAIRQNLVASRRFSFRVFRGRSTEHTEYTEMVNSRPVQIGASGQVFFLLTFLCLSPLRVICGRS